jgi:1-acyl-sn-glycerol-3-phosphate acyltransferase
MEFEAAHNIPLQGPVLMVVSHASPVDLFFCLALMEHIGRSDCRFVVSADMLDSARFRRFTEVALRDAHPRLGPLATLAARAGARLVPGIMRQVDIIPIYREGDDSVSRQQMLDSLSGGKLVTIAPERGNDTHRDASGLRPLTHGVASIARQFFELTRNALTIVPVSLTDPARPFWGKVRIRVGLPYAGMSDVHYPSLFGDVPAGVEERRQAYQRFTNDLTRRLRELIPSLVVLEST